MSEESEPRSEQINLRLTKPEYDVVQALIFLGEGASATEVLRGAVTRFLDSQASDDDVRDAVAVLERRRARRRGKVTSMSRRSRSAH